MAEESEGIWIITSSQPHGGRVERGGSAAPAGDIVSTDTVKSNLERFVGQIAHILDSTAVRVGDFELSQVSVNAQVGAGGKFGLLGTGVNVQSQASMTLVFERRPPRE